MTPQNREENQQTEPIYNSWSRNETGQATLVEAKCSHHCTNLALKKKKSVERLVILVYDCGEQCIVL